MSNNKAIAEYNQGAEKDAPAHNKKRFIA